MIQVNASTHCPNCLALTEAKSIVKFPNSITIHYACENCGCAFDEIGSTEIFVSQRGNLTNLMRSQIIEDKFGPFVLDLYYNALGGFSKVNPVRIAKGIIENAAEGEKIPDCVSLLAGFEITENPDQYVMANEFIRQLYFDVNS